MKRLLGWLLAGRGRHRHRRTDQPPPPVSAEETTAARIESEQALKDVRSRSSEVHQIAGDLRAQRQRNHFSLMIERALREGR